MTQLLKTIIIALIAAGLTACNNSSPTEEQGATPADNVFEISVNSEPRRIYTCPYNQSCDPSQGDILPLHWSTSQGMQMSLVTNSEVFQFSIDNVTGPGLYVDKATMGALYKDAADPFINWTLKRDVAVSEASVNFYEFSTSGGRTMARYDFVLCADLNNDKVFCGDISEMKRISGNFDVTLLIPF